QQKKTKSNKEAGSSARSSPQVLNLMRLRKKNRGSTNTSSTMSFAKLSHGVSDLPSEPFIASPKQPQSVTQVTSRISVAPLTTTSYWPRGSQVAVYIVSQPKKRVSPSRDQVASFILPPTNTAKPSTTSARQASMAKATENGMSQGRPNALGAKYSSSL